ncbi:MAG TPA: PilZ domain-containing protein [Nitrospirota bacterium]|nr:PilZ domain-containing protein [Nitrospirota bacterium]
MKKIIIADQIKQSMERQSNFLQRPNIKVFTAYSNEEVLKFHSAEKVDLIITLFRLPGMSTADPCSLIRTIRNLRRVSMIIDSSDKEKDIALSERCRANAVMTLPVNACLLLDKMQEFLDIPSRESCRVLLSVRLEGHLLSKPITCTSENISASGMLIETHRNLERGDRIYCSLVLPDSTRLETCGEIVRAIKNPTRFDPNWYGVKFSALAPEAKCAIEARVAKRYQALRSRTRDL